MKNGKRNNNSNLKAISKRKNMLPYSWLVSLFFLGYLMLPANDGEVFNSAKRVSMGEIKLKAIEKTINAFLKEDNNFKVDSLEGDVKIFVVESLVTDFKNLKDWVSNKKLVDVVFPFRSEGRHFEDMLHQIELNINDSINVLLGFHADLPNDYALSNQLKLVQKFIRNIERNILQIMNVNTAKNSSNKNKLSSEDASSADTPFIEKPGESGSGTSSRKQQ